MQPQNCIRYPKNVKGSFGVGAYSSLRHSYILAFKLVCAYFVAEWHLEVIILMLYVIFVNYILHLINFQYIFKI